MLFENGANDNNYFAGNINIGNFTPSAYKIDITGSQIIRLGGPSFAVLNNGGSAALYGGYVDFIANPNDYFIRSDGSNVVFKSNVGGNMYFSDTTGFKMTLFEGGNFRIGTGSDSLRKLQVVGEQEWITAVATGVHTTSGNYLPIWVNGVQYYLDLLN